MATGDKALGLNTEILRRDFLYGSLLTEGNVSLEFAPAEILAGTRAKRPAGQRTWRNAEAYIVAHAPLDAAQGRQAAVGAATKLNDVVVIDGAKDNGFEAAQDTGEVFDLVVIGGGLSGLAAAYYFKRAANGRAKVLILENHRMFGVNACRDEFMVKGQALYAPQASTVVQDLPPALAPSKLAASIFEELGINLQRMRVPEDQYFFSVLRDERSHGVPACWYPNILAAPISPEVRRDLGSFFDAVVQFYADDNWQENLRELDRFTFRDYAAEHLKWNPELFRMMVPELGAFFGFPDAVSAAVVFAYYGSKGPRYIYAFPGGNAGLARHLVKRLIASSIGAQGNSCDVLRCPIDFLALDRPENLVRLRLESTAIRVEHEGSPRNASHVGVTFSRKGKLHRLRARGVIMAGGGFIAPRVVWDMPAEQRQAYARFTYAPVLWINVALCNSRALDKAGLSFLSTYLDGFGGLLLNYEKAFSAGVGLERDPERPSVIGVGCPRFYMGLAAKEQEEKGRTELMETSFRSYERQVREDLARVLGPWGFDPKRDIDAISMNRWGHHGYVFGYPGFFTGGAAEAARKLHGRIAFAHTDLHRFSLVMGAVEQGCRATQEILECIRS
jgi:spermidine dehydrogenase